MRDILFRGKRLDNGKWVEGSTVWFGENQCFIMPPYPGASSMSFALTAVLVDQTTINQYTGLNDKHGTKTFEGDCIKISDYEEIGVICYGKYQQPCDDCCGGHIGFYVDWVPEVSKELFRKDLGYWADKVEIIGNIHDNPELLKEDGAGNV